MLPFFPRAHQGHVGGAFRPPDTQNSVLRESERPLHRSARLWDTPSHVPAGGYPPRTLGCHHAEDPPPFCIPQRKTSALLAKSRPPPRRPIPIAEMLKRENRTPPNRQNVVWSLLRGCLFCWTQQAGRGLSWSPQSAQCPRQVWLNERMDRLARREEVSGTVSRYPHHAGTSTLCVFKGETEASRGIVTWPRPRHHA